ncbi:hypothetical protein Golax_009940 [Gossypium laxum]|uniref:Uncharacterized protein n=2 Tax=Gossypium TaxID=3633 RepID=A0A7J8LT66_9ROSI|nr:hypothetical protein [Gossypium lobatum]MBA0710670.1 hypothetical protein [Gossypium laxum]
MNLRDCDIPTSPCNFIVLKNQSPKTATQGLNRAALMIMKNSVMIFFALVLLLASPEADGQRPENRPEPKLLSNDQLATSSRLGRKADVGSAATASLVAAPDQEDNDNNPGYEHYGSNTDPHNLVHHSYINGTNPYPKHKKPP